MRSALAGLGLATTLALGAAGCGGPKFTDAEVAALVSKHIESTQGVMVEAASCDGDLPKEVAKAVRCSVTVKGQTSSWAVIVALG